MGDQDFDGTGERTSSHTHHGHKGLLHVLMGTVHAHMGKRVHKHSYSYLQGRVSTLFIGHIDTCIHALVTSHAYGISWVPTGTANTGPLVLGPQMGPKLTCIFVQKQCGTPTYG